MNNIEYIFSGKPSFPKLGVRLPDNIDWTKTNVDPYSNVARHTGSCKETTNVNKSREPTPTQKSGLHKVMSRQKVVLRRVLSKKESE